MIVSMWRDHKVQPEDYNSLSIGARVQIDTDNETDAGFRDMTPEQIGAALDEHLDKVLEIPVDRAVSLGGKVDESHLIEFYELEDK